MVIAQEAKEGINMDPPPCKCGRTQVQYNTVAMYYIIQDNTIQYNIAQEAKEGINMDPHHVNVGEHRSNIIQ
jgi:hypothetical protein